MESYSILTKLREAASIVVIYPCLEQCINVFNILKLKDIDKVMLNVIFDKLFAHS